MRVQLSANGSSVPGRLSAQRIASFIVSFIGVFALAETNIAHAVEVESLPLLTATAQLYGDCGPVPRCFSVLDDLKPNKAVIGSSGQVSIFARQPNGEWQLTAALLDPFAPQPRPYYNSNFGYLASLDANQLAVAAQPEDKTAPVIYLFTRHREQWSLQQTIELQRSFGDVYLKAIKLDGDALAVSEIEYAADATGRIESRVLLFAPARNGQFQLQQQLDPAKLASPSVAYNIALANGKLVLATPEGHNGAGAVYFYSDNDKRWDRRGHRTSHWQLEQTIQPPRNAVSAGFGTSISLDGKNFAVSAPYEINPPPIMYPGGVYVYRNDGNRWRLSDHVIDPFTIFLPPPDDSSLPPHNPFGTLVAISGKRLLVRHLSNYQTNSSTGILYEKQHGNWLPVARLGDPIAQNLALAGSTAFAAETFENVFSPFLSIYELPALTKDNDADSLTDD